MLHRGLMQNITARQYNCLMDFTCAWEEASPFAFPIPLRALAVCMSVVMKSHKMGCIFCIVNSETATVWQIWVHTIGPHLFYYYSNYLFFSICKWNSHVASAYVWSKLVANGLRTYLGGLQQHLVCSHCVPHFSCTLSRRCFEQGGRFWGHQECSGNSHPDSVQTHV